MDNEKKRRVPYAEMPPRNRNRAMDRTGWVPGAFITDLDAICTHLLHDEIPVVEETNRLFAKVFK